MLISNRKLSGDEADSIALDAFMLGLAADVAAFKATFKPVFLITAPSSPIVQPGLYLCSRPNLTIALGTPTLWRGGLVTIKDFTDGAPSTNITGAIDGGSGATINVSGESLSFSWSSDDNYWVTT